MARSKTREILRLVINTIIFAAIVTVVVLLVRLCSSSEDLGWKLEDRPLKIETIRKIAELSTVSYTDEAVMDTIEYYKDLGEQVTGNIVKLSDLENWKYSIRGSNIKRRLTLIVGGEVRFGFDLKDTVFNLSYSQDSVFVQISEPKILDILVVPSKTIVFQEHGEWHDRARRKLQQKAVAIFAERSKQLELEKKSKQQLEQLLKKMIADKGILIMRYK